MTQDTAAAGERAGDTEAFAGAEYSGDRWEAYFSKRFQEEWENAEGLLQQATAASERESRELRAKLDALHNDVRAIGRAVRGMGPRLEALERLVAGVLAPEDDGRDWGSEPG